MNRLIFLIPMLLAIPAQGQSLWRNFFTTNRDPLITITAGSNATVQASTVGVNQRVFTVNAVPTAGSTQTNISWTGVTNLQSAQVPLSVITNANYLTNWAGINTNTPAFLANNQTFTGSNYFTIPLNSSLTYPTNQGALTIAMSGRETWLAFSTNADFAIAGLSGVDTTGTNVQKFTIIVTNTAGPTTKLMTVPASWIKHDGINCYVTNQGILTGVVYPSMGTNAAFKCLK